ncbi:MAG: PilZ domain-containing protein [Sphingomicrobium sp.]
MKYEPIEPPAGPAPPAGRPQRDPRRLVEMSAHVRRPGGQVVDVAMLDLSPDGCRVRTPEYLWPGEAIQFSIPRRGVIEAAVRWCKDGEAGLAFAAEEQAPEAAKVERASVRFPAASEVTLRRLGHLNFRVSVRDISPAGCRIDLVERPAVGETLHLKFQGLDVLECTVRWVDGYVAGLAFARPFHPAVFDILLDRLDIR